MKRKRFGIKAAVAAGVITAMCGAAMAETIWVNSEVVEIRTGKGAIYPVAAKVNKGQELTVVGHEGKWIKVVIPGADAAAATQEGYVFETAISATKVNAGGGLAVSGASNMSTGAAAKGLQPSAESYASGKGMSSAPLNALIAMQHQIKPEEWERFKAEGHVGQ